MMGHKEETKGKLCGPKVGGTSSSREDSHSGSAKSKNRVHIPKEKGKMTRCTGHLSPAMMGGQLDRAPEHGP